jgi:hypothetical protein
MMIFWSIPKRPALSLPHSPELLSLWEWLWGCRKRIHSLAESPKGLSASSAASSNSAFLMAERCADFSLKRKKKSEPGPSS